MTELIKNEVTRITLGFQLDKAAKLGDGEFEAILSTDELDSHGEHVAVAGIQIKKDKTYRIYWNHDKWGDTLPIGAWTRIWKSGGKLMGRGKLDLEDDFALKVYKKVQAGIIDEVSVGIRPLQWDTTSETWTKSELTEASLVSEGANPDAKVTNKFDFTEEEFTELENSRAAEVSKSDETEQLPETPEPKEPETTEQADEDVDKSADIQNALDELKNRVSAVEKALEPVDDETSESNLISVRLAAKQVDKQAEKLNKIIKVSLRKDN